MPGILFPARREGRKGWDGSERVKRDGERGRGA